MKTIAITNNKGGVGKTTSAQNIAASLSRFGKNRVLMLDLDSQASLTKSFGLTIEDKRRNSGAFITGELTLEEVVCRVEGMDLLPATTDVVNKEDTIKSAAVFPFNLKLVLNKYKEQYDYVVIDCPPALSGMTRIALVACDAYFVPLQAEYLSYEGLRNFLEYAGDIKLISPSSKFGGVFSTRYNPKIRKKISNALIDSAQNQLGDAFLKTYIRENVTLSEAQSQGQSVYEYMPKSNGAIDYYQLTKEIIERL